MPVWLQIVIAVAGLIGTLFGVFGITVYIQERLRHKAQKKNQSEDDEEAKKAEDWLKDKCEEEAFEEYKKYVDEVLKDVD